MLFNHSTSNSEIVTRSTSLPLESGKWEISFNALPDPFVILVPRMQQERTLSRHRSTQLSLVGHTKCKGILENNIELSSFRDSSITGCTITNDRRFRAGFADNNLRRFCHESIESLHHVIHDCPKLPCRDIQPRMPLDCGPNFPLLGIVEVPEYIVANKLRASSTAHIPVAEWCQSSSDHLTCLWTDGSCDFPEFFWMCTGGFSITDINGFCIHSGSVQHPALCSYTTELWA